MEMEFEERVNFDIAKKLNNINYMQFTQLFNKSTTKKHNEYNYKQVFSELKKYTLEIMKTNNKYLVNYGHVESKNFGRLYAKNSSLQRIYNGFRGILSQGITYDLDMNNCHPNIL